MANPFVLERLAGIQNGLMSIWAASAPLSASTKGQERQYFIEGFLANVLPPVYRIGTGDATDSFGKRSGQLDVVVEYPFAPTLPSIGNSNPTRLYLAESIAAVIEVKSDAASQWDEAKRTAAALAPLQRSFGAMMTMGAGAPSSKIPLYVAGYKGWKDLDTLKRKLDECADISGILVIEKGLFYSRSMRAEGPYALWALISELHYVTSSLQAASTDPINYVK